MASDLMSLAAFSYTKDPNQKVAARQCCRLMRRLLVQGHLRSRWDQLIRRHGFRSDESSSLFIYKRSESKGCSKTMLPPDATAFSPRSFAIKVGSANT